MCVCVCVCVCVCEFPTASHACLIVNVHYTGSASMSNNLKQMETDPLNQHPYPSANSLAHLLILSHCMSEQRSCIIHYRRATNT